MGGSQAKVKITERIQSITGVITKDTQLDANSSKDLQAVEVREFSLKLVNSLNCHTKVLMPMKLQEVKNNFLFQNVHHSDWNRILILLVLLRF